MRSELDLIRDLYNYNSVVRKEYLNIIFTKVPEEERYRPRGASFPSLVDIFVHVLDAYRWWFIYVYNDRPSEYERLREKKKYTMQEVKEEERKIDELVLNFVKRLKQEDLDRKITFTYKGRSESITVRNMVVHMVEEELQHRGELNALLWQLDIDPPILAFDDVIGLE
ncbi:MAG: DinB family protein [Conexivisphaerales archaeon]